MSIQLKLDANAVAALFPEGSDIRLELQQTVIGEVVRRLVDKYTSALRSEIDGKIREIEAQAREAFVAELKRQGLDRNWAAPELSKPAKELIASAAREAYNAEVTRAIAAVVEKPALETMERRLNANLEAGLRLRLDSMAKEALEAFRGALK